MIRRPETTISSTEVPWASGTWDVAPMRLSRGFASDMFEGQSGISRRGMNVKRCAPENVNVRVLVSVKQSERSYRRDFH